MRGGDRVVRVGRAGGTPDDMAPPRADLSTRRDLDDGAVLELEVGVAGKVGMVDVLDRVVAGGCPETLELALVHAVDRHLLEDGVGVDSRRGRQGDKRESLHSGCFWLISGGGGGLRWVDCQGRDEESRSSWRNEKNQISFTTLTKVEVLSCLYISPPFPGSHRRGAVGGRRPGFATPQIGSGSHLLDRSTLDRLGASMRGH